MLVLDAINNNHHQPDRRPVEQAKRSRPSSRPKGRAGQAQRLPAITLDGHQVKEVRQHPGPSRIPEGAIRNGAEGVVSTVPSSCSRTVTPCRPKTSSSRLKEVAESMPDQPIIVRTMDIGDKELTYMNFPKDESLPGLACRAYLLRSHRHHARPVAGHPACVCLWQTASCSPMIISVEEFRSLKATRGDAESRTACRRQSLDESIEVGIMIEPRPRP